MNTTRILCFGDSIVAGSELPPQEKNQAWPALLEAMSKGSAHYINAGRGGRPSDSYTEFVTEMKRQGMIDQVIFSLGTNDSRDLKPDCAARASTHLDQMIGYARAQGVKTIWLLAPCNINRDALGPTKPIGAERDAQLRRIGEAYKQLAQTRTVDFASLYGVISPANLAHDGVHPNAAGNHEIARYLYPILTGKKN